MKTFFQVALVALCFLAPVFTIRMVFMAYCEEKEHAEHLYDCTHFQTPQNCENQWQGVLAERNRKSLFR